MFICMKCLQHTVHIYVDIQFHCYGEMIIWIFSSCSSCLLPQLLSTSLFCNNFYFPRVQSKYVTIHGHVLRLVIGIGISSIYHDKFPLFSGLLTLNLFLKRYLCQRDLQLLCWLFILCCLCCLHIINGPSECFMIILVICGSFSFRCYTLKLNY